MANKRIIDQTTTQTLSSGDYVMVDNQAGGSKKFDLKTELSEIKQDLQDLQEEIEGGGSGLTAEAKQALLDCFDHVVWDDDDPSGNTYISALRTALYPPKPATGITLNESSLSFATLNASQQLTATVTPSDSTDTVVWSSSNTSVATVSSTGLVTSVAYGSATITATAGSVSATCSVTIEQATLTSISATYTQSGTVYDTDSLDDLKADLVVTATWSDSSTSTVASNDYTLSGTLAEGTSTITVSYGGKTATFTVNVTEAPIDTTVQLDTEHMNKGQSNTFGSYSNKTGFCPTIKYPISTTLTSGYDYIKGIIPVDATGSSTSRIWFYYQDDAGAASSAYGSGKPMNVYSESMTEGQISFTPTLGYVAMTIPVHVDYLDDSYLYIQSTGDVLFAGRNTPYYGMSNISEAS